MQSGRGSASDEAASPSNSSLEMWDRLPQAHCLVICRDCLLEVQRLVRWVLRSPLKRSHLCKGSSLAVMSKCSCASTNHRPRGRHKRPRVNLRAPFFSARRRPGGLCARRSSDARAVNMAVKSTKKTKKKNTKHENTAPERTKHQNTAPTRRGSLSSVIPHCLSRDGFKQPAPQPRKAIGIQLALERVANVKLEKACIVAADRVEYAHLEEENIRR